MANKSAKKSTSNPTLSIVMATYNSVEKLPDFASSLEEQKCDNFEVVIQDGGSTDGTLDLLSSNIITNLRKWKSEPDKGIYNGLNKAFEQASGEWIIVLGSDDQIRPNSLITAIEYLENAPADIGLLYCDLVISSQGAERSVIFPDYEEFTNKFNGHPPIHHQTAFIRRSLFIKEGGFNLDYKIHADYDLLSRIASNSKVSKANFIFAIFNDDGFSSSFSRMKSSLFEIMKIRETLGVKKMPLAWLYIYFRQFIKKNLKTILPVGVYRFIYKLLH